MKTLASLVSFALIVLSAFCASAKMPAISKTMAHDLTALIEYANKHVGFNGTLLVANKSTILYEQSIGYVDNQSGILLSPEYAFNPGSITKEFSTLALMSLKQKGKISFNQPISTYLPQLPNWAHQVTIEHLLNHTSGIADVRYRNNMTTEDAVKDISLIESPKFTPGTQFLYSNNNTILRSLIVSKVTEMDFDEHLHTTLFKDLNMADTISKSNFAHINKKIALGSKPIALVGVTAFTTARDLLKLERFLWSKEHLATNFLTEAITKKGLGGINRAYFDFGFYQLNDAGEITSIEHDGTFPKHYSLKYTNLEHDYHIILLSNDGRKDTLYEIRSAITRYIEHGKIHKPTVWQLIQDIEQQGVEKSVTILKQSFATKQTDLTEQQLNLLAYDYFYQGEHSEAVALLELNVEIFHESLNAIDSYVEVLLELKQTEQAKPWIKKGLHRARIQNINYYKNRFEQFQKTIDK